MAQRMRVNAPHVIHEAIEGEVIIIDLSSGNYYSLKGAGADIWQAIERAPTDAEIVDALVRHYESADRNEIADSVASFLARLKEENLVVDADGAASGDAAWAPTAPAFETPQLEKFTDMQELVLLDPVHEVDATGWPQPGPGDATVTSQDA